MVYIPRVVWLSMEGGLMKFLVIISFCWWKVYDWVFARNVLMWKRFLIAGKKCSRQDCGRCPGEKGSADTDIQGISLLLNKYSICSKYFSFPQQIFHLFNYLLSRCTCITSTPSTPSSSSSASFSTSLLSSSLSSWLTGPSSFLRDVSKLFLGF